MNWKSFFASGFNKNLRAFRRRWFYPMVSVVVAFTLCLTTALPSHAIDWLPLLLRGVQVVQLSNMSQRQEVELGGQINQQLTSREVRIFRNPQVNSYIQQIGQRVAAVSDRPDLPYTFQIIDDESVNAFTTMGGFIYLNTGLIKTADNEAQLASVIAHEIGHNGGKHMLKHMQRQAIQNGLLTVAGLDRSAAVQLGVDLFRNRPRSREDEFDADRRGFRAISRAGYSQEEMVAFMKKLQAKSAKSSAPAFLSTHPATGDRVNRLQSLVNSQPNNRRDGIDDTTYRASLQPLLRR
jgi:beta-barrel assembly-enhancing protease